MSEQVNLVIGNLRDHHRIGAIVLRYTLTQAGFKVEDVGPNAEHEDFIKAAIETDAKAILISSSYGMAEIDCRGLREKCKEAGLGSILLYAGGNLVIGMQRRGWEDVEKCFREIGFNRVYPPAVDLEQVIDDLKKDLNL